MCILLYIKVRWWIWHHHFPYLIDSFWLHHWLRQAFDNCIVCPRDLRLLITPLVSLHFRSVYSLSFDLQLLITPLVSLHFRPVYCMFFDLQLLITPLVFLHFRPVYSMSFDLQLRITPLISLHFRPVYCLSFDLQLLISPLLSLHFRPVNCLSFDLQLLQIVPWVMWPSNMRAFSTNITFLCRALATGRKTNLW